MFCAQKDLMLCCIWLDRHQNHPISQLCSKLSSKVVGGNFENSTVNNFVILVYLLPTCQSNLFIQEVVRVFRKTRIFCDTVGLRFVGGSKYCRVRIFPYRSNAPFSWHMHTKEGCGLGPYVFPFLEHPTIRARVANKRYIRSSHNSVL